MIDYITICLLIFNFYLKAYPVTRFGKQNRAFCAAYFEKFDWLEYSVEKNAIYCFVCRNFISGTGYSDYTFVTHGFSNWKKVSLFLISLII